VKRREGRHKKRDGKKRKSAVPGGIPDTNETNKGGRETSSTEEGRLEWSNSGKEKKREGTRWGKKRGE